MKIAIMEEFTRIGGGQRFAGLIAGILSETGYKITLVTDYTHNYISGSYDDIRPTSLRFTENDNLFKIFLRSQDLKKQLAFANSYDIVINNHPNIFLFKGNINSLHSISIVEQALDYNGRITHPIMMKLLRILSLYSIYNGAIFWAPTKFNAEISRTVFQYLGIHGIKYSVIPIPIFNSPDVSFNEKKNQVLVFGRISPEKELEKAFEIASSLKVKFIISGAVNPGTEKYYENLKARSPKNVEIIPNPSEEAKELLFRESKVILHLRRRENFPISLLEGISYGCVPVVPKSGGPWYDIVEYGKYGEGFENENQAITAIKLGLNYNENKVKEILGSRERFSLDKFKKEYLQLVEHSFTHGR